MTVVVIVKYFIKNNMTPPQLMRCVQGSFSQSCDVFILNCLFAMNLNTVNWLCYALKTTSIVVHVLQLGPFLVAKTCRMVGHMKTETTTEPLKGRL